jgi:hypothetical protein
LEVYRSNAHVKNYCPGCMHAWNLDLSGALNEPGAGTWPKPTSPNDEYAWR